MLYLSRFIVAGSLLSFALGCTGQPAGGPAANTGSSTTADAAAAAAHDHAHDHPSTGPHNGTLVELGNHEYHLEVTHDATSVTLYVLDDHAAQVVAVDAKQVTINLMLAGTPKQFTLPATPDATDPEGKSSRFSLADSELVAHLDDHAAAPSVSLTIAGTPYHGKIEHDHDHDH